MGCLDLVVVQLHLVQHVKCQHLSYSQWCQHFTKKYTTETRLPQCPDFTPLTMSSLYFFLAPKMSRLYSSRKVQTIELSQCLEITGRFRDRVRHRLHQGRKICSKSISKAKEVIASAKSTAISPSSKEALKKGMRNLSKLLLILAGFFALYYLYWMFMAAKKRFIQVGVVSAITCYPVTSCQGISFGTAECTNNGITVHSIMDREFFIGIKADTFDVYQCYSTTDTFDVYQCYSTTNTFDVYKCNSTTDTFDVYQCNSTTNTFDVYKCNSTTDTCDVYKCNSTTDTFDVYKCNSTTNTFDVYKCNSTTDTFDAYKCYSTTNTFDVYKCNSTTDTFDVYQCYSTTNTFDVYKCNSTTDTFDAYKCNSTTDTFDVYQCNSTTNTFDVYKCNSTTDTFEAYKCYRTTYTFDVYQCNSTTNTFDVYKYNSTTDTFDVYKCNSTTDTFDVYQCYSTTNTFDVYKCNSTTDTFDVYQCNSTTNTFDVYKCNSTTDTFEAYKCYRTTYTFDVYQCNSTTNTFDVYKYNSTTDTFDVYKCYSTTNTFDVYKCNSTTDTFDVYKCYSTTNTFDVYKCNSTTDTFDVYQCNSTTNTFDVYKRNSTTDTFDVYKCYSTKDIVGIINDKKKVHLFQSPQLNQVKVLPDQRNLVLSTPKNKQLKLPMEQIKKATNSGETLYWRDLQMPVTDCGDKASSYLTAAFNSNKKLSLYNFGKTFSTSGKKMSYVIIPSSSIEMANAMLHLNPPLSIDYFRPNILVSKSEPFDEENWETLRIGEEVTFKIEKSALTILEENYNTDEHEWKHEVEPYLSLPKAMFVPASCKMVTVGVLGTLLHGGEIHVGDDVFVTYKSTPLPC
ncbi:hypothetical protein Btru_067373 [Bulinus truncatus]|nr:hypothetical protein Btru_067373 [Bulinus truncatus]